MGTAAGDTAGGQDDAKDQKPVRWCRACGEPVRRRLDLGTPLPYVLTMVHAATGKAEGPDGHLIVLTDENPELRAVADKIEAEYGGITVSVRFGWFRADWKADPGVVVAHVDADTESSGRSWTRSCASGSCTGGPRNAWRRAGDRLGRRGTGSRRPGRAAPAEAMAPRTIGKRHATVSSVTFAGVLRYSAGERDSDPQAATRYGCGDRVAAVRAGDSPDDGQAEPAPPR